MTGATYSPPRPRCHNKPVQPLPRINLWVEGPRKHYKAFVTQTEFPNKVSRPTVSQWNSRAHSDLCLSTPCRSHPVYFLSVCGTGRRVKLTRPQGMNGRGLSFPRPAICRMTETWSSKQSASIGALCRAGATAECCDFGSDWSRFQVLERRCRKTPRLENSSAS